MVLFYVAMVTHLGVLLGMEGLTAMREPQRLVSVMVAHLCVRVWGWCVGGWVVGMCAFVGGVCMCGGEDVCVCLCIYIRHPPTQHNVHVQQLCTTIHHTISCQ